jgi:hypothetical protein
MSEPQPSSTFLSEAAVGKPVGMAPVYSSAGKPWRGFGLSFWQGRAEEYSIDPVPELMVILHHGGAERVFARVGSNWFQNHSSPGRVTIVPPGVEAGYAVGALDAVTVYLTLWQPLRRARNTPSICR